MVIRKLTSPNRVEIEQYGNPNFVYVVPISTVVDGQAFSINAGHLEMSGVIESANGSTAVVTFDEIAFNGTSVCDIGTYTFNAE